MMLLSAAVTATSSNRPPSPAYECVNAGRHGNRLRSTAAAIARTMAEVRRRSSCRSQKRLPTAEPTAMPTRKQNRTRAKDWLMPCKMNETSRTHRISWLRLRKPTAIDSDQAKLAMALHPRECRHTDHDVQDCSHADRSVEFKQQKPSEADDRHAKGSAEGVDLIKQADRLSDVAPQARHMRDQDRKRGAHQTSRQQQQQEVGDDDLPLRCADKHVADGPDEAGAEQTEGANGQLRQREKVQGPGGAAVR